MDIEASAPSLDLSSFTRSDKPLSIIELNDDLLPALLNHLSKLRPFPPPPPSPPSQPDDASITTATTTNITSTTASGSGGSGSSGGSTGGSTSSNADIQQPTIDQLLRILKNFKDAFVGLKKFEDQVCDLMKTRVIYILDEVLRELGQVHTGSVQLGSVQTKLRELDDIVTKLRRHVPLGFNMSSASSDASRHLRSTHLAWGNEVGAQNVFDLLPYLHLNERFWRSPGFKDFEVIYESLRIELKLCLLCFSVFPENAVIKKRLLIYWWIGEGLLVEDSAELVAEEIFYEFVAKGFIKPFRKKHCLESDNFTMHAFVRSVITAIAKQVGFFDFDSEGNPTANFCWSHRACLVKVGGKSSQWDLIDIPDLDREKLHTLFNISEPYLDFELDWFSKMKNINVLCLGRWQSSPNHHIEVEDTEFLKGLKNMKHIRYFSLQGVSRITELPDTICKLSNLRILDLRACHNLEVLPEGISSLSKLTHLDMSECYLLDRMPKGLALLSELLVLKGFVIGESNSGDSCSVEELAKLGKLRKLSINTAREGFLTETEMNVFSSFKALGKLTIAWGGDSLHPKQRSGVPRGVLNSSASGNPNPVIRVPNTKQGQGTRPPAAAATTNLALHKTLTRRLTSRSKSMKTPAITAIPLKLEKLDLRCFPESKAPKWLVPTNLMNLKKLYIRGGGLHDLGEVQNTTASWKVKILRLKFLNNLEMNWKELRQRFQEMIYLEKVKCPKLTFFPCDENGVWMRSKESEQLQESLFRV